MNRAQGHPAANQNRRLNQSPIIALIYRVITGRLRCLIPVRLNSNTLARQRITTVVPQGWSACRGAIRRVCPPQFGHSKGNTS